MTGDLSFDRSSVDLRRLVLNVNYRGLRDIQLVAGASYDARGQRAQLVSLNITGPIGRIRADGVLALDPQAGESYLNGDTSALDALALMQALELPYWAATRLDGHVRVRWPALEFARATGDAKLSLAASRPRPSPGLVPIEGDLVVSARENLITASITGVRAAATTVDGRVSLTDRRALGGMIHAKTDDLARVIGSAEAVLGRQRGSLVGTQVAGSVAVGGTLGGTIDAPTIDVAVQAPSLAAGAVSGVAVNAQARYTPEIVALSRADLAWQGARVHANGELELTGRRAMNLAANVDGFPIDAALAALGLGDIPATGTLVLNAAIAGTVSNPNGTLTLHGTDLVTSARLSGRSPSMPDWTAVVLPCSSFNSTSLSLQATADSLAPVGLISIAALTTSD